MKRKSKVLTMLLIADAVVFFAAYLVPPDGSTGAAALLLQAMAMVLAGFLLGITGVTGLVKDTGKKKLQGAAVALAGVFLVLLGAWNGICMLEDLAAGTRQDKFSQCETYRHTSVRGMIGYYVLLAEREDGSWMRFKISDSTRKEMEQLDEDTVVLEYYENSGCLVRIVQ